MSFEENIVYDTQSAAFHQGSDEGSVEVRNNVFADPKWAQVMRSFEVSTDPNHEAFVFEAQHRHS